MRGDAYRIIVFSYTHTYKLLSMSHNAAINTYQTHVCLGSNTCLYNLIFDLLSMPINLCHTLMIYCSEHKDICTIEWINWPVYASWLYCLLSRVLVLGNFQKSILVRSCKSYFIQTKTLLWSIDRISLDIQYFFHMINHLRRIKCFTWRLKRQECARIIPVKVFMFKKLIKNNM